MARSEGFEAYCPTCGRVAGRVRVVIDSKGIGRNSPEGPIPPRCPDCQGSLVRRPL